MDFLESVLCSLGSEVEEASMRRRHEEPVWIWAQREETKVRELQANADLKDVPHEGLSHSPLSRTRRLHVALQGKFGPLQMRYRDLKAKTWILPLTRGNSMDPSFVEPKGDLISFHYDPSKIALLENCPECDDTAIKDHFSFRSKDEEICDDAVDSDKLHRQLWSVSLSELGVTAKDFKLGTNLMKILDIAASQWRAVLLLDEVNDQTSTKNAEGERSNATIDEDDVMTRFALFFKQHIEDALEPLLGPLASVLQSQGKAERKHRDMFLALEEKKLAQRRMKIQLKRRRPGHFQPTRRASSAKSSRLTIRQRASTEFPSKRS